MLTILEYLLHLIYYLYPISVINNELFLRLDITKNNIF